MGVVDSDGNGLLDGVVLLGDVGREATLARIEDALPELCFVS